jgi:hypothetical protein
MGGLQGEDERLEETQHCVAGGLASVAAFTRLEDDVLGVAVLGVHRVVGKAADGLGPGFERHSPVHRRSETRRIARSRHPDGWPGRAIGSAAGHAGTIRAAR